MEEGIRRYMELRRKEEAVEQDSFLKSFATRHNMDWNEVKKAILEQIARQE